MALDVEKGLLSLSSVSSKVILPSRYSIGFLTSGNSIYPPLDSSDFPESLTFGSEVLTFTDDVLEF